MPQLARTVPPPSDQADWPAELGRLAPDLAARRGRGAPPPPVASPELERLRLFDAVLRLAEWAAAGRPVLLVAEDVHRADPASMQLCAHIGRRLASHPVLFVLTRRDKPERPPQIRWPTWPAAAWKSLRSSSARCRRPRWRRWPAAWRT